VRVGTCSVQPFGHLLGTPYHIGIPTMVNQHLQYFCVECGNELLTRIFADIGGRSSSQECPKCAYTLLFGTIKKKSKEEQYNG
jgi:DNA-directed RNA polymerase subunit RPC12/RpoP